MSQTCLFCGGDGPFTDEHPIPESLGNTEFVLVGEVCRSCNQSFSDFESRVLQKSPIGWMRVWQRIPTKRRKPPRFESTFPASWVSTHDNDLILKADKRGRVTCEVRNPVLAQKMFDQFTEGGRATTSFEIPPKLRVELSRFLAKMSLGMLCLKNSNLAREERYDDLRRFARHGELPERMWPAYMGQSMSFKELIGIVERGKWVMRALHGHVGCDEWFFFAFGVTVWAICMTNRRDVQKCAEVPSALGCSKFWRLKRLTKS